MKIARLAVKRPVATSMIFLSLLLLGLVASRMLPLEYFPDVDAPFVGIQAPYPGSTPWQVEEQITRPLEEALATMRGIRRINSNSRADGASVFLVFDWNTNVAMKAVEAREKVDSVRKLLPDDLRRINVFKFSTSDQAILTIRVSSERDLSNAYELLQRKLVRPVQRLPGVARVELQGVEAREIRIEIDLDRLNAHGVGVNELVARLEEADFNVSGSLMDDGEARIRIVPERQLNSADDFSRLILNEKGVLLEDVANISFLPKKRDYARHLDQRYAVGLEVFKERGANLVDVGERVIKTIEEIGKDPEMQGIQLFFLNNQAEGVKNSLKDLLAAGLIGAFLSLVVLYVFLRNITTTLMVAMAVPVSVAISLGGMYLLGLSLNILSMMGLMLAVGMLVDNAVVVSESIFKERDKGHANSLDVVDKGVNMVGVAVLAGTLTSAIVFLPNIFGEQNNISIFLSHVAFAITIALMASLLISLTVIPMISARLKHIPEETGTSWTTRLSAFYGRVLEWTLSHRKWTVFMMLLVFGLSVIPMKQVKKDIFPPEVTRQLFLQYNLNARYPLDKVKESVNVIEDYLYSNKEKFEIDAVYTYYNENGTAQSSILLLGKDKAKKSSTMIMKEIREGLPKIAVGKPAFQVQNQGGQEGVSVTLVGESSSVLYQLADNIVPLLSQIEGLVDVRPELSLGAREIQLQVDRQKMAWLGLQAQDVATAVSASIRGKNLKEVRMEQGEVPVFLSLSEEDRGDVGQLQRVSLTLDDGSTVPLSSVVSPTVESTPHQINRTNRETALRIRMDLEDVSSKDARKEIRQLMDKLSLPDGYRWSFGSGFTFERETEQKMVFTMIVAIGLIYLVMAALFESLLFPASIVTSIVFSVFGVYWFFWITSTTFSLMAMIGILILIGIVVNNGIVLVDHINQLRRGGLYRKEAIIEAGKDRLRPILMTVATTVLGLVPLAVGDTQIGGDGPPYYPMARAIIGGLLFATFTGLLFLPTIYAMLDDFSNALKHIIQKARYSLKPASSSS